MINVDKIRLGEGRGAYACMHPKIEDGKNKQKKKSAKQIKKIGAQYRSVGIEWKDKIEREADIGGVCQLVMLRNTYSPVSGVVISCIYSELDTCYFLAFRMQPQVVFYCF